MGANQDEREHHFRDSKGWRSGSRRGGGPSHRRIPAGVCLPFGSVARGDAGPDSDYDLLVVVPDDAPPERRRSRLAYEALRGTGTAADVIVCTRSYFEQRRLLKASLPGTVLREGRVLHPGESEESVREEAEQALAVARIVYEAILNRMPPEAQE
jgi:uncharacterized protein